MLLLSPTAVWLWWMCPSVHFIDSQLQRETASVLLFQVTENRQPGCTQENFTEKIRRGCLRVCGHQFTPRRFLDQYKPSATFVAFLWKQTRTEYNMCDALAPCQAVTLKSRFLSFPSLCFISAFSLFLWFALIVVWLDNFYRRRCYLTWFCSSRTWLCGQRLSSLPRRLATLFQMQHVLRSFLLLRKPVERRGEGRRAEQNETQSVCVPDLLFQRSPTICTLLTIYLQRGVTAAQGFTKTHVSPGVAQAASLPHSLSSVNSPLKISWSPLRRIPLPSWKSSPA